MTAPVTARGPSALTSLVGPLYLDDRALSAGIGRAQIIQSEGSHDEVTMTLTASSSELNYDTAANKRAFFPYGVGMRGRFYGYVVDVTPGQRYGSNRISYELTLMGVSFVMKTGRPRFFSYQSAADVISGYAKANQLGFSDEWGKQHYTWPQLAQTDESDWEFCTTLAGRIGGVLMCAQGVLRLIDPTNVLRRQAPLVYSTRDNTDPTSTELYDFVPTHYSERMPSTYSAAFSYLSGGRAVVVGQLDTPATPRNFDASTPVRNITEAEMAQVRLPVTWEEQGTARLRGDHHAEPGATILFKSSRMYTKRPVYDGLWYIWRSQHTIEGKTYQTQVDIARVSKSPVLPAVSPRYWYMTERGGPQITVGRNGEWTSTWR